MQSNAQFDSIPALGKHPAYPHGCAKLKREGFCSSHRYDSMTRLVIGAAPCSTEGLRSFGTRSTAGRSSQRGLKVLGSEATGAVILSAVAGYVDTAGFMTLFGLFTAHITGDLVTAGTSLTERLKFGAGTRLVMIPIFMISVAATTLFARKLHREGRTTLAPMLGLMTSALAMFAITGTTLRPLANAPDAWAVAIIGGAGVVAMGIQNTLMRNVLSSYSPTTIMTGNLTQCTIDLVEMALPDPANDTLGRRIARGAAGDRLKKFGLPLLGFMFGAFLGAWLTHLLGLASISVPTLAVGLLALHEWLSAGNAPRVLGLPSAAARREVTMLSPCTRLRLQCAGEPLVAGVRRMRLCPTPTPARSGTFVNAQRP